MITAKGTGFLVVAAAVYLLARLSQVGWLYLADAVLWALLIISALQPWAGVAWMRAERRLHRVRRNGQTGRSDSGAPEYRGGQRVSEGDPVRVEIGLQNRAFYPRFFHSVFYESSICDPAAAIQRFLVAHLPGSTKIALDSDFDAYRRGRHLLGPVTLESSAPFGLFRRRRSLTGITPVLVLPKVYALQRMNLVDAAGARMSQPRVSRMGLDIAGARPYVRGDSRRMIHWRNTARAGRPMVKEVEEQTEQTIHVIFDANHVYGEGRETTLEYAIKLVASVANYAMTHRVPAHIWGGGLGGGLLSPGSANGSSDLSWDQLLERLAVVEGGQGESVVEVLERLPSGANLFLALSSADAAALRCIERRLADLGRVAMVRLEGFGEPSSENALPRSLDGGGSDTTTCQPGELTETILALEGLGSPKMNYRAARRAAR